MNQVTDERNAKYAKIKFQDIKKPTMIFICDGIETGKLSVFVQNLYETWGKYWRAKRN